MRSGTLLKQIRTYLKSQVGHWWSVEGRKRDMGDLRKEDRTEVDMIDILGAGTKLGALSDVWSMCTDEKDDAIFYLKCLS